MYYSVAIIRPTRGHALGIGSGSVGRIKRNRGELLQMDQPGSKLRLRSPVVMASRSTTRSSEHGKRQKPPVTGRGWEEACRQARVLGETPSAGTCGLECSWESGLPG